MTQNEIIMLNQKSPSECHKLLIKEYGKYVYIIVFNHLRNCGTKEDIEECVSDIFAELFINLESDFYSGDIKSSLGTLAKRRAVNYYHKLMNHNSEYTELTNHLADDMDIVSAFEKKERQHIMMQCIKQLGKPDSDIIILKYYYKMSAKEISKRLSIKSALVQKRAERAVKKLKKLLSDAGIKEEYNETL